MKNFFTTFLACLAAIVASSILLSIISLLMFAGMIAAVSSSKPVSVEPNSVLKIDFSEAITDSPAVNPLSGFNPYTMKMSHSMGLLDVLNAIEKAGEDENIKGIYLNISGMAMGMATAEEIRNELIKFKETGKFIISYADYYSQGTYFLSSVADKVYVNPEGGLEWQGLASQIMFYKGALDKLGVKPEIVRCGEFKSAVEPFITDKMSPANREQMDVLTGTIWGKFVSDIAKSRSIDSLALQQYASTLALTDARAAAEKKMVDGLKYNDEILKELAAMSGKEEDEDPQFISLSDYISYPISGSKTKLSKNKVAIVYAEGNIVDGQSEEGMIGGETLAAKLADVRKDDDIKAVVLRVNSPGGSALASEVIWREMTLLQQEKPVIVSMGNYAASGGYYISCPADAILADRMTLTGSIGVFGLMFNVGDALKDKLGVTVDVVKTNESADMGSMFRALSPAEQNYLQNSVNGIYKTFVGHVAKGRNLSEEEVLKIGGGRVWSGISADHIGLIDGFGGLKDAVLLAADRAGVPEDFRVVTPTDDEDQLTMILKTLFKSKMPAIDAQSAMLLEEYGKIKQMMEQTGVQARMPYTIQIR